MNDTLNSNYDNFQVVMSNNTPPIALIIMNITPFPVTT